MRQKVSLTECADELRCLSIKCKFLPQALHHKFVCGVQNHAIQKHLLTEARLMLESTLKIATRMERLVMHGRHETLGSRTDHCSESPSLNSKVLSPVWKQ